MELQEAREEESSHLQANPLLSQRWKAEALRLLEFYQSRLLTEQAKKIGTGKYYMNYNVEQQYAWRKQHGFQRKD